MKLEFEYRYGLWHLQVNGCRGRFYRNRSAAEKVIARYNKMLAHRLIECE